MLKFKTKNIKIYNALGLFLKRKGFENNHSLSLLFINKFVLNNKKGWQQISSEELKSKRIIISKKYPTFMAWRLDMIDKGLLICMATSEELKSEIPTHKANKFKPGEMIEKYINKAISEDIFGQLEKVDNNIEVLFDSIEKVENRMEFIESKFDHVDDKLDAIDEKFEKMAKLVLRCVPPDTERRRRIIKSNYSDSDKCLMLLLKDDEELQ